jgi:hypothetical protein
MSRLVGMDHSTFDFADKSFANSQACVSSKRLAHQNRGLMSASSVYEKFLPPPWPESGYSNAMNHRERRLVRFFFKLLHMS